MHAVWYEQNGDARAVLHYGELADPQPGPGEVRVRIRASGVNPSDVKTRAGTRAPIAFARIIPHSDGAGEIDMLGAGVDQARLGERVWLWNAAWQRADGTCAGYVCLPAQQAVPLPAGTDWDAGACLGIPADRLPCRLRRWRGERPDGAGNRRRRVDRIVEVEFGGNLVVSTAVLAPGGVIAAYGSMADPQPQLPFYPLMFNHVTIRTMLVYLLSQGERTRVTERLGRALEAGALNHAIAARFALEDTAAAHEAVESGTLIGNAVILVD